MWTEQDLMRRARRAYELARLKRAVLGFAPVLLLVIVAMALGNRPLPVFGLGAGLFVGGVALLWYGRDPARAVLPGVLAGVIPLCFALCASRIGHVCHGDGCVSVCLYACSAGGLLAGAGIGWYAQSRRCSRKLLFPAAGFAVLTGAMGCSCVGYTGVIGLVAGLCGGVAFSIARTRSQRTTE
ncbi:MAG TPA: hypothetical protein VI072_15700 [Polyangiaceae bacterium]